MSEIASISSAGRSRAAASSPSQGRRLATRDLRLGGKQRIDRRSWAYRNVKRLVAEWSAALGHPRDAATQAAIRAAAELATIATARRAELLNLKGEADPRMLDALIRVESELRRAMRALKLDQPKEPPRKSFLERLREEANGGAE